MQLNNSIRYDCRQYLIFNSRYNTYSYRNKYTNLIVFEIDTINIIQDKIKRLNYNNIDKKNTSYIISNFENCDKVLLKSNYDNKYKYNEIQNILEKNNFLIYENLNNTLLEQTCINTYNIFNPNDKIFIKNKINLCMAVKRI